MLTGIVFVAPSSAWWPDFHIPINGPEDQSFFVKEVTGLDPVSADITSRGYGELDGEFFVGSHVGKRNILIKIALVPVLGAVTVSETRSKFFVSLPIKFLATLRFEFDDREPVSIQSYVESVENNRFTAEPELQVSFISPKPNFRAIEDVIVTGETGESNPTAVSVPYEGTAGGGWIMDIEAEDAQASYTGDILIDRKLGSDGTYQTMKFKNVSLPMGWRFHINTHQGQKQVENRHVAGLLPSVTQVGRMDDTAVWFPLYAAEYFFRVRTPGVNWALNWTLRYFDQFTGV